jgi:hypothetical protein
VHPFRRKGRHRHRLRFVAATALVAVIAGIAATAAWATLVQVYFVGSANQAWIVGAGVDRIDAGSSPNNESSVMALTGEFSNTICSGCLTHAYLQKSDGTRPCDGTAYGYVLCALAPNVVITSRAHCHNPSSSSSRWFECWKWRSA